MRAATPDLAGTVDVGGISIAYESFGDAPRTILLMPTWCVVHARAWKMQIPYLTRHFRVVTFDGPGNGNASRPTDPEAYSAEAHVRYTLSVLDALGIKKAVAVASSGGTHRTLRLAADHPDRIDGVTFVGPLNHVIGRPQNEVGEAFMTGDLDTFLDVFMRAVFSEPHSTKAIEDGIEWGHGTTMEILAAARTGDAPGDLDDYRAMCASIDQPVLIVQGTDDRVTPEDHGRRLAEMIGDNATLVLMEAGGHRTDLRDPVRFSLLLRDFVRTIDGSFEPASRFVRSTSRPKRALYLSSPIGLGHARRDAAVARELRALRPDVEIDWLAQDPVTRVLAAAGESIHPASNYLVNESEHMTRESDEHYLHCFQAWRRMDEILTANFMVLNDVLESESYDLVIGDEAWEADHFFHENPELKRAAFAWLTDFVGWLPMPEGGDREVRLTADYNLEMIEHVDRYPRVRDRAIFVGDRDDLVGDLFGPGLPSIRAWTEEHFDFAGYITGSQPLDMRERARVRAELGFGPDEKICVTTVGGSGVGTALLRKAVVAAGLVKEKLPEFRMVAVAGPRIDPEMLQGAPDAVEVRGFVPDLDRHLAVCDVAVIQGGLTTAMELAMNGRPFLYFPLGGHFEQRFHVPHRLRRYGAGRQMEYSTADPDEIAATIIEELDREPSYQPVEGGGAARAAAMISALI